MTLTWYFEAIFDVIYKTIFKVIFNILQVYVTYMHTQYCQLCYRVVTGWLADQIIVFFASCLDGLALSQDVGICLLMFHAIKRTQKRRFL